MARGYENSLTFGAASARTDPGRSRRFDRADAGAVRHHSQRFFSRAGHRQPGRLVPNGSRGVLPSGARQARGIRRHRAERSGGGIGHGLGRRGRRRRGRWRRPRRVEWRDILDHAQAARAARCEQRQGHGAAAAGARPGRRRAHVHATGSRSRRRRKGERRALSIYAAGRQLFGAGRMDRENHQGAAAQ